MKKQMKSTKITAEELFLQKYGNKITASDSWVIRFAEEYSSLSSLSEPVKQENELSDESLKTYLDRYKKGDYDLTDVKIKLFPHLFFSPKEQKGKEITDDEIIRSALIEFPVSLGYPNDSNFQRDHNKMEREAFLKGVSYLRSLLSSPSQQTEKPKNLESVLVNYMNQLSLMGWYNLTLDERINLVKEVCNKRPEFEQAFRSLLSQQTDSSTNNLKEGEE